MTGTKKKVQISEKNGIVPLVSIIAFKRNVHTGCSVVDSGDWS